MAKEFQYRCISCNEGEITFEEWAVVDTDAPGCTPADTGYLALVLGCTSCLAKYLLIPQQGYTVTMRKWDGSIKEDT